MGIRLKKCMGYALTDVQTTERGEIADERINSESFLLNYQHRDLDEYKQFLLKKGGDSLDTQLEISMLNMLKTNRIDTADVCIWNGEYGSPEVLLLPPLGLEKRWVRYDDDLDYTEERLRHDPDNLEPRILILPHAPYPFNLYIDRITGERVKDTVWTWWQLRHATSEGEEKKEALESLDLLSEDMGYADFAEAKDRVIPVIPDDVRHVAEWGELFTGPDVWKQLRPALYTYWT